LALLGNERASACMRSNAELCCVLAFAGNQHYPPSWVEATTSLDQVVIGSATPVGASQWSFCRTGSRASCPAPGDILDPSRQAEGEGGPTGCSGSFRLSASADRRREPLHPGPISTPS